MIRLSFLSRFILLIVLLLGGISLSAQTRDYDYMSHDGIRYIVYITGVEENAVADSAYVVQQSYIGSITISSSVTYEYNYSKIVGYDSMNHPIYQTFTRYLTCPVKGIAGGAFYNCTGLTNINIPNSVTVIGVSAFKGCTGLTSIVIPNSVRTIHEFAFDMCMGLTKLTIGESVGYIYSDAFSGCHIKELTWNAKHCSSTLNPLGSLGDDTHEIEIVKIGPNVEYLPPGFIAGSLVTEVNIPNSVTSIGESAFSGCTGLDSIDIPNSVTSIGDRAFSGCTGLDSIDIPNSVTSIGDMAFSGCSGLSGSLTIPKSLTKIGNWAFLHCKRLKKLYWNARDCIFDGDNNSSNTHYPFGGCDSLCQIVIGSEVEYIGDILYNEYFNIDTVTCYAVVPPIISKNCFSQVTYNNAVLCVPRESVEIYRNTKRWQEFFKCIAIETIPGGGGGEELLRGDVDGDGQVTIADVTALIDLLLSGTGDSNPAADVDGDGVVTISDVASLIDLLF